MARKRSEEEQQSLLNRWKEKFSERKNISKTYLRENFKEKLFEFFSNPSIQKSVVITLSIILIFILLTSSSIIIFKINLSKTEEIPKCGDGSVYDTCSLRKPYYCSDGILTENASSCGCPENLKKEGDYCASEHQTNPRDITLNYILRGEEHEINFTIYEGVLNYLSEQPETISYSNGEIASRRDFKLKNINDEIQKNALLPLVTKIQNLANNEEDRLRIAVSIAQHVEWGGSNKTIKFNGFRVNHSRYIYEVLAESQGLCGEKSELLSFLLKEMGYGTAIFYNQEENHESLGIKCPVEKSWHDTGYCFVETSGPSIITDTGIVYANGFKLQTEPEVLIISEGKSLPGNLYEYKDAKDLMNIRKGNILGMLKFWKADNLKEKYGLLTKYNAG